MYLYTWVESMWRTTHGNQLSPSTIWVSGLNSGCQTWQRAPLLSEPSRQPTSHFHKERFILYSNGNNAEHIQYIVFFFHFYVWLIDFWFADLFNTIVTRYGKSCAVIWTSGGREIRPTHGKYVLKVLTSGFLFLEKAVGVHYEKNKFLKSECSKSTTVDILVYFLKSDFLVLAALLQRSEWDK